MKKMYAGSIGAEAKYPDRTEVFYTAYMAIGARSEEEAIGQGIREAQKKWSLAEGYVNHRAIMMEAPQWIIKAVRSPEWDETDIATAPTLALAACKQLVKADDMMPSGDPLFNRMAVANALDEIAVAVGMARAAIAKAEGS